MHNKCGPWTFIQLHALIHVKQNRPPFIHLPSSAGEVRLCDMQRKIYREPLLAQLPEQLFWRLCLVESEVLVVSFKFGSLWVWENRRVLWDSDVPCPLCTKHEPSLYTPLVVWVFGDGQEKYSRASLSFFFCHLAGNRSSLSKPLKYRSSQHIRIKKRKEHGAGAEQLQAIWLKFNVLTLQCSQSAVFSRFKIKFCNNVKRVLRYDSLKAGYLPLSVFARAPAQLEMWPHLGRRPTTPGTLMATEPPLNFGYYSTQLEGAGGLSFNWDAKINTYLYVFWSRDFWSMNDIRTGDKTAGVSNAVDHINNYF